MPGQVEDDASIMRGSPQVRTKLALLQAVRAANPDAWILCTAHSDVVAGNRQGAIPFDAMAALAVPRMRALIQFVRGEWKPAYLNSVAFLLRCKIF